MLPEGILIFDIYSTASEIPDQKLSSSQAPFDMNSEWTGTGLVNYQDLSDSFRWFTIDYTSDNISLTQDLEYAIVVNGLVSESWGYVSWQLAIHGNYPDGGLYVGTENPKEWIHTAQGGGEGDSDVAFRVEVVPEPSTTALLVGLLAGSLLCRKRRAS